jgi:hypothetical protein
MNLFYREVAAALFAAALFSTTFWANAQGTRASLWSTEITGDASFLGSGSVANRKLEFNSISEIESSAGVVLTRQITDTLQFRVGGEYQIYSFDTKTPTPIPDVIQGANLVVGANFNIGQAILARIDAKPGFYGEFSHLNLNYFNVPFDVGATYFVSADFQLIAGFEVNLNRRYFLFPTAGVYWRMANKWVLNGVLPRPQLEYSPTDKLTFHIGADFGGSTFRMNNNFGSESGNKKLNNAILDYMEVRTGAGMTWQAHKNLKIDIEAGCVPYRRFDYNRASFKLTSDDVVPYVRIGLTSDF